MSVDSGNCCESAAKKIKISDDDKESNEVQSKCFNSFINFKCNRILSNNPHSKSIFLEGSIESDDKSAVVLLEKLPFKSYDIDKLFKKNDTIIIKRNNTAQKFLVYPEIEKGDIKATIIYPATPKHIEKYSYQPLYVIEETPEIYQNIVLPHLQSQEFSLQWVYNILDHKSEVERIVFEDPDSENGFILLPDLKWNEAEGSIYLIAICHSRNIKSLRDLNLNHIPLLENIKSKSLDVIWKKYNIPASKLRIYLHYQPSYYHLHVHFNNVQNDLPGIQFEKAHLLDNVIENIRLCDTYYKKATLIYNIKENDPLVRKFKNVGMLKL